MLNTENDRFIDKRMILAGHTYLGRSVGGEETCHQFPSLKLAFDIGYAPLSATSIPTLWISHGHDDHCGGLARHAIRRHGRKLDVPIYYVPSEYIEDVRDMIQVRDNLSRGYTSHELRSIKEGDEIELAPDYTMKAFRAFHRIPCLGYALWRSRKKLKSEFQGKSQAEIVAAKRSGIEVQETISLPEVVFCGDTRIEVVETYDFVRTAKVLILECTMLDVEDSSVDKTRKAGHIHLDEIIERADLFQNQTLMLTHFSARYSSRDVQRILNTRLPVSLKERVVALL